MESVDEVRASLAVDPFAMLGGARGPLVAELARARPLACLGAGLAVDRRYPERLRQFDNHRFPDRLFADAGCQAYAETLARARFPVSPRPSQR